MDGDVWDMSLNQKSIGGGGGVGGPVTAGGGTQKGWGPLV